jgi:hypothetical protein
MALSNEQHRHQLAVIAAHKVLAGLSTSAAIHNDGVTSETFTTAAPYTNRVRTILGQDDAKATTHVDSIEFAKHLVKAFELVTPRPVEWFSHRADLDTLPSAADQPRWDIHLVTSLAQLSTCGKSTVIVLIQPLCDGKPSSQSPTCEGYTVIDTFVVDSLALTTFARSQPHLRQSHNGADLESKVSMRQSQDSINNCTRHALAIQDLAQYVKRLASDTFSANALPCALGFLLMRLNEYGPDSRFAIERVRRKVTRVLPCLTPVQFASLTRELAWCGEDVDHLLTQANNHHGSLQPESLARVSAIVDLRPPQIGEGNSTSIATTQEECGRDEAKSGAAVAEQLCDVDCRLSESKLWSSSQVSYTDLQLAAWQTYVMSASYAFTNVPCLSLVQRWHKPQTTRNGFFYSLTKLV